MKFERKEPRKESATSFSLRDIRSWFSKRPYREVVFTVRVVYKSGYTHDFEVTEFTVTGTTWKWKQASDQNKPVVFGVDEIAAVWQIGYRRRLVWR